MEQPYLQFTVQKRGGAGLRFPAFRPCMPGQEKGGLPPSLLLGFYVRAGSQLGAGGETASQKWVRGAISMFKKHCVCRAE